MPKKNLHDATARFEQAELKAPEQRYVLALYVTGMSPQSMDAIANIRQICEQHLK